MVTVIGAPDAKMIFTKAPFLQYQQFLLDKSFRQYIETIMILKKIVRMKIQKAPMQKKCKMSAGSQSINVDFFGANRQFDWTEILLVYDKSDKHTTIYDSYNVELASKIIKLVALENFTEAYALTNQKKYDINNNVQKHLLYKQFVAWHCNGCSIALLTDYIQNPIYQELPTEKEYFSTADK